MKTVLIIAAVLTGLLLFSTTVCGLWIRGQANVDATSIQFHMNIALVTVATTALSMGLALVQALRA